MAIYDPCSREKERREGGYCTGRPFWKRMIVGIDDAAISRD